MRVIVKLALMDGEGNILQTCELEKFNAMEWKSGCIIEENHDFIFESDEKGTKLAIGLFSSPDREQPDIAFDVEGKAIHGWHLLTC